MSYLLLVALLPATDPGRLVLGHDRGKVAILDAEGKVKWQFASKCDGHDIAMLPCTRPVNHVPR